MLDVITVIFLAVGVLFFLGATVGVIRFPDFFTRMHAASKGDTLSSLCLIFGFIVYLLHDLSVESIFVSLKLFLIIVFLFLSTPTAAHALTEAAYSSGARPWLKNRPSKKEEKKNV